MKCATEPPAALERAEAIFAIRKRELSFVDLVRTEMGLTTALPSERTRAFHDGRLAGRVLAPATATIGVLLASGGLVACTPRAAAAGTDTVPA